MQTMEIKKDNVFIAYKNADTKGKKMLEDLFGKQNLSGNIMDMVKDFDDILLLSGKTMADMQKPGDTPDEVAYRQAKLIAEVYNEGAVLDPFNTDQPKYYPWHKISGFGLSYDVCGRWSACAGVGSRLCFKSSSLAADAGKKFIDIYTVLKTR